MPEKIPIHLGMIPGGEKYRVQINAEDEEVVREAANQLQQKFVTYKKAFFNKKNSSGKDISDADIMAMVAIDIATSHLLLERKNDLVPFAEKIQQFDDEIKDYLKEQ
ncbi:MAG: cell division protein ZapA [Tannerella sp.]|jgi:cell division protein ZapA (FtsZ GTPase activity inhibitor)|nr:cell division protein ZapA [Tannerella sp.]